MSNKTKAKGKPERLAEAAEDAVPVPAEEPKRPALKAVPKGETQPETTNLPINKLQVAQITKAHEGLAAAQQRLKVVAEGILAAAGYEHGEPVRVDETDEGFVLVVQGLK